MSDATPYQTDIQKYLKAGKNTIVVEVANTPEEISFIIRCRLLTSSHAALEPSGMFGKVILYWK